MDPAAMPPPGSTGWDRQFEAAVLEGAGDLAGLRVLELGCGTGDLTLRLLDQGARVTALDLSPGLVAVARRRVSIFRPGADIDWRVAPVEASGLPTGAFDVVLGKWILHHTSIRAAAEEVQRLLTPGGRAVFVETSALNPVLSFSRRHLVGRFGTRRYGTADERPLNRSDIAEIKRVFETVSVDFPNFILVHLLDRHIARWRWRRFSRWCRTADRRISSRLPRCRWLSYYMRVVAER